MTQRFGAAGDLAALSPWAKELARTFVSLSSDIALVLDDQGVITDVAQAGEPMAPGAAQWVGRAWADTVTGDTRRKIELLLEEATGRGVARRREVNHPGGAGADIPVAYTAIRLGAGGPVLAVGRDLRTVAAIQQQFLDAQQELERGYWRTRQAEARERLLQQVASDAVFVLDADALSLVAANAAALRRFALAPEALAAQRIDALFEPYARGAVLELMSTARSSDRPVEIRARAVGASMPSAVTATPFRAGDAHRLLVRLRPPPGADSGAGIQAQGLAVVDASGRVLNCDPVCAELLGAVVGAQIEGRMLGDWLGADAAEFRALLAAARREGLVEREGLVLRLPDGRRERADIGASWITDADQECIGIVIRARGGGMAASPVFADIDAAWQLVSRELGQMPLRELLRRVTALAERQFIETALQRSGGDVAAAAALLGLSTEALARRRRRLRMGSRAAEE